MDLLDLYHVHEHSMTIEDDTYDKKCSEITTQRNGGKIKKPKFVPWEPYKAAPSADRKGKPPIHLPTLIPYKPYLENEVNNNDKDQVVLIVDKNNAELKSQGDNTEAFEKIENLSKEVSELSLELEIERKLNRELKRLMVATISDELQGQVQALTEDKIRLAHRVEEYSDRLIMENGELDRLQIECDVWKCKFLAQSIRTDELSLRTESLLRMLNEAQQMIKEIATSQQTPALTDNAQNFLNLDLQPFFMRSPCDQRTIKKGPNYANLTISCCRNCAGKEIYLL